MKLEEKKAVIDTFLMSCRVMGRNVETDFLAHIEKELAKDGIREIIGEYIPTGRNNVIHDLLEKAGYTKLLSNDALTIRYNKFMV